MLRLQLQMGLFPAQSTSLFRGIRPPPLLHCPTLLVLPPRHDLGSSAQAFLCARQRIRQRSTSLSWRWGSPCQEVSSPPRCLLHLRCRPSATELARTDPPVASWSHPQRRNGWQRYRCWSWSRVSGAVHPAYSAEHAGVGCEQVRGRARGDKCGVKGWRIGEGRGGYGWWRRRGHGGRWYRSIRT